MLSSIAVQGTAQQGGKLVAMGDVTGLFSHYIRTYIYTVYCTYVHTYMHSIS